MTILAKVSPAAANAEETIYTVPAAKQALCSVRFCNKTAAPITVDLGVMDSGESTTGVGGFLEYGATLLPNGILENTGLLLAAGDSLRISASSVNVACVVFGHVENA